MLTQSGATSGGIQVFPFFEFEVFMGSGVRPKYSTKKYLVSQLARTSWLPQPNLPGFDQQVTARTEIIVREEEPSGIILSAPMSWPLALKTGKVNDVIFTVALDGHDRSAVESVTLVNPETSDLIHLNNDGLDGDVLAGDTVWSGTAVINTSGITSGTCQKWIASGYSGGQAYYSSVFPLCVTEFPIGVSEDESVLLRMILRQG
jgi:hypothetical protein